MTETITIAPGVYKSYFDALRHGDKRACARILDELLTDGTPLLDIYEYLIQRSMYEIGALWERNCASVAVEHRASTITEGLLHRIYPRLFEHEPYPRKAVVCCAANEYHQIGGKIVADTLELYKWDTHFLGANTPVEELLTFLEDQRPGLLGLSLSVYFNLPSLFVLLDRVRKGFPEMPILVGGQAFRHGGVEAVESVPSVRYVRSIRELEVVAGPEDRPA